MKLDIDLIKKNKMSIRTYLDLRFLYFCKLEKDEDFVLNYGGVSNADLYMFESIGFIKIVNIENYAIQNRYELREPLRDLFEGEKDLFLTWFSHFPLKTPTGRYLRPKTDETIMGKKLRAKWNKHFKNNTLAAQKAIKVLDAEMTWRRQTGKFEFMNNAETWLNKGNYEMYEELLDSKDSSTAKRREDYE
tara:strand:+ start:5029 stop:5598 length:570 start_codon:yes stop_codon:yes gene_type:complete